MSTAMASVSLILCLPNEILEYILQSEVLSAVDVCNFGSTCRKFRNLVSGSKKLWKTKFFQRWPDLQDTCDHQRCYSWQYLYQNRLHFKRDLQQLLAGMSRRFRKMAELSGSDLSDFVKIMQEYEDGYAFMVNELMNITHDGDMCKNLTQKFYAEKIMRYVRQQHLKKEWQDFLALDLEDQLLEQGAVLVAQWCQPMVEVTHSDIAAKLDNIALEVKRKLFMECENHPVFCATPEKLKSWRNKNISGDQWKPLESQQIISAVCTVLFQDMGFHGHSEMYYSAVNCYINKVLEDHRGIPVTLSIVFESVARRLGVKCELVSLPAHFLLRWRGKYNTAESGGQLNPYYYIDVLNGGQFLTKRSCPRYSPDSPCPMRGKSISPATPVEVIERMANNLVVAGRQRTQMNGRIARLRSALELLNLVDPSDMNCSLHLARFYMLYTMDVSDLMSAIAELEDDLEPHPREQARHILDMLRMFESQQPANTTNCIPEIKPKLRTEGVSYAVGMIMQLRQCNYKCVIYGWDTLYTASRDWFQQIDVNHLPTERHQPFYKVLVEDGSTRYVAQEDLEVALEPRWVQHLDVGRYFEKFCNIHYVPNTENEMEYPQDGEVRLRFVQEQT